MSVKNKTVGSHIFSWRLHGLEIPDGLQLHHNCPDGDNPRCCNPAHLWVGTQLQNVHDMIEKGRAKPPKGEDSGSTKFTTEEVLYIRNSLANKTETIKTLKKKHNTSFQAIYYIAIGQSWGHVGGPLLPHKTKQTISQETVDAIRAERKYYGMTVALAKKYGISQTQISRILSNRDFPTDKLPPYKKQATVRSRKK